ncbi:MAG TPA: redoxin domain-containing protein [Blastocatellia bacterium]|nr:redoxin domain-containing protein [Blastocatellia bacterium]
MQRFFWTLVATFFLTLSAVAQPTKVPVGQPAPDFTLKDTSGKAHSLKAYRGQTVVIGFVGTKCPIANAYITRMNGIAADYKAKNVVFLGINSNVNEPLKLVKEHAAKAKYGFAILKDDGNVVADSYGASVTPEMYIIDAEGVLRYHGRVDNASDERRVERHDLRVALDELLAGHSISKADLKAFGCVIKRAGVSETKVLHKPATKPAPTESPIALLKPADFNKLKTDSQGKVLLINFWATWCAPCVAEFPEFVMIDKNYRAKGVRTISISTDEKSDMESAVLPFLKKQKAEFESFISDSDDPQELIDVVDKNWSGALPATFVFDKSGKLVFTKYGIIDREELLKVLEAALKS